MKHAASRTLKRSLSFFDAVSIGIGAMVGAGIFAVIGVAALSVQSVWALLLAFLLAGIIAAFSAFSMAELAHAIPKTGASYEYARELVSREAGFAAGFLFVFSKTLEAATVAVALAAYAAPFLGLQGMGVPFLAVLAIAIFSFVNWLGIKASALANHAMVAVKLGVLLLFVALGMGAVKPANLPFEGFAALDFGGIFQAAAIIFFAYTGYARVATLGGEIRNPRKVIPMAIAASLAATGVLYLLVAFVAGGVLGIGLLSSSQTPIALASSFFAGGSLAALVSFAAIVATASVCLGDLLSVSRTLFAMGSNNDLPKSLSSVDKGNPRFSVLVAGAGAALLAALFDFRAIASITSLSILAYYAIGNFSALSLGKKRLYPTWVSHAGLLGCIALAFFLPFEYWALTVLVLAAGFAYYIIVARKLGKK